MTRLSSLFLVCFFLRLNADAQMFTRVTDPTNPIVSDRFNSGGGSWADFNNDGFLDLFVANGNDTSMNNSLYLNNRNGNFIKVIGGAIVNDGGTSIGGTWGDYNNDGKHDVFVTNRQFTTPFGNFFYRGNGDTVFTKVTTGAPATDMANSNSSSWVDVNGDGALDLFVVNFQSNNYLYYNSGPPAYTFARPDTGDIVLDGTTFSIVGVWADYNNDRKPDLFIGNAGNQNDFLFTNGGNGTFAKSTFADARSTLGASWGDYDNDGDPDLFVANYLGQNNLLYRNSGPPGYALTRMDTGVVSNDGGFSVGSVWGDVDNDGDLDLFVCNDGQNNAMYLNSGPPGYGFSKVTVGAIVNDGGASFGCAAADFDNNGSLDLFVANRLGRQNFLYLNNGNSNSWVNITCVGATNRSGIGTKVRVRSNVGGIVRWQTQELSAQSGYNSQTLSLHFGLGDANIIDSVRLEWQSGATETFVNLATNQNIMFEEGVGPTNVGRGSLVMPTGFMLHQNYPNPFNPVTTISLTVPTRENVSLKVFDILGRDVATLIQSVREAGGHSVNVDASEWGSGVYLYRLTVGNFTQTKQMLLIK
ncbi:MAG: FG-GAP-like repeat-containing protein [Bacteroidota bacterium]